MNKPRDGNIPSFHLPVRQDDKPDSRRPLQHLMESGLAEPRRNTGRNRHLARLQGWTDQEWELWVDTGRAPGQLAPEAEAPIAKPTTQRITDEIDERVGRRLKDT